MYNSEGVLFSEFRGVQGTATKAQIADITPTVDSPRKRKAYDT